MKITTVFFDLDGTLLLMNEDDFVQIYFKELAKKVIPMGYDKDLFVPSVWQGTKAMIKNDGTKTNEEAFWEAFSAIHNKDCSADIPVFDEFYTNEFQKAKAICKFDENSKNLVDGVKKLGLRTVLATNPIFPSVATKARMTWAGLDDSDFEYVSTYENSHYAKPNPEYYKEICKKINISPEECIMIGNNVDEDMISEKLGMKVFLCTEFLINKSQSDIGNLPQGSLADALEYIQVIINA